MSKNICENCSEDENLHSFPHKSCPGVRDTKFKASKKLVYQEVNLTDVMAFYSNAFDPKPDAVEVYIDKEKNKAIFKCFYFDKK